MKNWFINLSSAGKVVAIAIASVFSIGVVGAVANNTSSNGKTSTVDSAKVQSATLEVTTKSSVITKNQVTETSPISYDTSTVNDSSVAQGTDTVATEGQNGELTTTYDVNYQDGKETSRSKVSEVVTKLALAKVIHHGTMAPAPTCSNGTYVNTYGNTVCSPYASSSAPAGASAQCSDGTYSFSQSRSGTCSHHGGVSTWL